MEERTHLPVAQSLPCLLSKRSVTLRGLARELEVTHSYLSRAVRGVESKRLSPHLLIAIADRLGVAPDYFPEYREYVALAAVRRDAAVRDQLYDSLPEAARGSS